MTPITVAIFLLLLALFSLLYLRHWTVADHRRLPPGPRALPIIGNLHRLGNFPHRTLCSLSKTYGPIMSIHLGKVLAIVVSSPEVAKQFLKTHDTTFAGRPRLQAADYFSYGRKSMGFSDYGPYWRGMRKLCAVELLSLAKIESFAGIRKEEVELVVQSLKEAAAAGEVVDVSAKGNALIESMTYRTVLGRNAKDDRFKLKHVIQEAFELVGAFNLSDYVPYIKALDLQGINRRSKAIFQVMDKILDTILDEHMKNASDNQENQKDFVDVMLSLMKDSSNSNDGPEYIIERTNIKAIIFELLAGAIDTSSNAIEWFMAEMVRHPRVMKKLQEEIQCVAGMDRLVEETDLSKFNYLDMVLKESLRLHPVGALLVPHESMEEATINGYYIPKRTRIMFNAWATGRDPNIWSENVNEFYPERFQDSGIDLRGQHYELMPFGSGRRGCPGMQLALVSVKLVLAQFVHCFNWELPNGMLADDLDMTEQLGLSTRRARNLLARPIFRLHI